MFANVKPSVVSWLVIGISAATFIVVFKWLMSQRPVPGLSDIAMAI